VRWRLYRLVMKVAHRFHWCYLQPMPQIERDRRRFRCSWCGADRTDYTGKPAISTADMTGGAT
jgi:hypothetical protein